jgi:biotin/methionine sulfoxide reductase
MPSADRSSRIRTGSHWGVYDVEVDHGRLVRTRPFAHDPHPSRLIESMPSAIHHQSRITHPMVRQGFLERGADSDRAGRGVEPFVPVDWDTALDLVASELKRVKATYGNEALYASSGWASAGLFHSAQAQLYRFLNGFGGYVSQVTNYSFGAASVIVPHIVGTMAPVTGPLTAWPTIRDHTELMLLFGGMAPKNLQVNNGGVGRHDAIDWLKAAHEAGVQFVNISPMRSDMADVLEAQWLAIRPNTDTAFMLALAHTLVTENLHDEAFLQTYCTGFDRFLPYLLGQTDGQPKDASWAAAITEIPADAIRALARRMAASRTMISVSWSIQRADHGEQPYWAAITLAAILGQIGLPGGGFGFGYCASHSVGSPSRRIPLPKLPVGRNPVKTFIPVARFADMLLNPGAPYAFNGQHLTYPDIRLVYWCGGNPFHKIQDLNQLLRAWHKPETIIIHEPWWTPAARRADIVLPCVTTLERNDIGGTPADRFVFAMPKAIEPVGAARTEYAIYTALAQRLGFAAQFTEERTEMDWLRHLYDLIVPQAAAQGLDMPGFEAFWEAGYVEFPLPAAPPVLFEAFRRDPVSNPLKTPSGRIELFSSTIDAFGYDDCPGHAVWLEPAEWLGSHRAARYPLHLISNQPRTRLHSQLDCGAISQGAKVAGREAIRINPADAASRSIADGDTVRMVNDRGACLAGAIVTDEIRPGVVEVSTGAWFDPESPSTIGSLDKHGNPNVLTRDRGTSRLAQSCSAQTTLVDIERYEGEPPAITAFIPPVGAA